MVWHKLLFINIFVISYIFICYCLFLLMIMKLSSYFPSIAAFWLIFTSLVQFNSTAFTIEISLIVLWVLFNHEFTTSSPSRLYGFSFCFLCGANLRRGSVSLGGFFNHEFTLFFFVKDSTTHRIFLQFFKFCEKNHPQWVPYSPQLFLWVYHV